MELGTAKSFSPAVPQKANHTERCSPEGCDMMTVEKHLTLVKQGTSKALVFQTSAELTDVDLSFNARRLPTNLLLKTVPEPAK